MVIAQNLDLSVRRVAPGAHGECGYSLYHKNDVFPELFGLPVQNNFQYTGWAVCGTILYPLIIGFWFLETVPTRLILQPLGREAEATRAERAQALAGRAQGQP